MILIKRKSGIYYLRYEENGATKYLTTRVRTKQEALQFLYNFKPKKKDFNESVINKYLEYSRYTHSSATHRTNLRVAKMFLRYGNNFYKLNTAPATANLYTRHLKAMYNWAHRNKLIEEVPQFTFLKEKESYARYLTADDLQKLFAVIDNENHRKFFKFAILTGLRLNEIIGIKQSDIVEDYIIVYTRKNNSYRQIPLTNEIKSNLQLDYKISDTYISRRFKRYCRKAGIDYKFHNLRNTFLKNLVNHKIHSFELKAVMNHSSIKTSEKYFKMYSEEFKKYYN